MLAQEEVWIRQGIKARRTRNEGRVRRLEQLRRERAARTRTQTGKVGLSVDAGERSGKLVAELEHVSKSFGDKTIIHDFSCRIMRGDKIGLLGPNGAGKSTLLKIILGELQPDSGTVKLRHQDRGGLFRPVARAARMRKRRWPTPSARASDFIEIGG